MTVIRTALVTAALSGLTKSVGTVARIGSDLDAPKEVRADTAKRELLLLGSGIAFTALLNPAAVRYLPKLIKNSHISGPMGASVISSVAGLSSAEVLSRHVAPPPDYAKLTGMSSASVREMDDDHGDHDDDHGEQLEGGAFRRKLDLISHAKAPSFSQALPGYPLPSVQPFSPPPASQMFTSTGSRLNFSV